MSLRADHGNHTEEPRLGLRNEYRGKKGANDTRRSEVASDVLKSWKVDTGAQVMVLRLHAEYQIIFEVMAFQILQKMFIHNCDLEMGVVKSCSQDFARLQWEAAGSELRDTTRNHGMRCLHLQNEHFDSCNFPLH